MVAKPGGYKNAPTAFNQANAEMIKMWGTATSFLFGYAPLVVVMVINTLLLVVLKLHARSMKHVHTARGTKTTSGDVSNEDESGEYTLMISLVSIHL